MQTLVDAYFREAVKIRVVLGNLNIHTPAALYEVFSLAETRHTLQRLEFDYTPKHGS